jgi:hypothetical protein
MQNDQYDNIEACPQTHPDYPDRPVDSWRADIMDFGAMSQENLSISGDVKNNINMVAESFCNYNISFNGKHSIAAADAGYNGAGLPITNGGQGVTGGVSGFSILREKSAGLMVVDPTRLGVIRLAEDFVA